MGEPTDRGRDGLGEQLAGWGKVALIETRGRVSGRAVRAAVGFVSAPGDAILVAAGAYEADWARNLEADSRCLVTIGDQTRAYRATPLEGTERNEAIVELILRYGTPAERLGAGPAFRLDPIGRSPEAAEPA